MKLSMGLGYAGGFKESVQRVVELEKAGLDQVWVAEAYSFDAISQVGYLAAMTNRIEIGTGIVNVYSRSAALMAMTAAGCDYVSDGRFILGLGASGPQVIEGFHGVRYDAPLGRTREVIETSHRLGLRSYDAYSAGNSTAALITGEWDWYRATLDELRAATNDPVAVRELDVLHLSADMWCRDVDEQT